MDVLSDCFQKLSRLEMPPNLPKNVRSIICRASDRWSKPFLLRGPVLNHRGYRRIYNKSGTFFEYIERVKRSISTLNLEPIAKEIQALTDAVIFKDSRNPEVLRLVANPVLCEERDCAN